MKRVRVKPSKGQSTVGFIAGLVFCGIGLFIVVPVFGVFGVIWTIFAIIITVAHGANVFSDKGIATHEISIEDDIPYEVTYNGRTTEERLNELQTLYDKGMITADEFREKRKKIIDDL